MENALENLTIAVRYAPCGEMHHPGQVMVGLKREVERSPVQRGKRLSGDTQRVKKTRVGPAEVGCNCECLSLLFAVSGVMLE